MEILEFVNKWIRINTMKIKNQICKQMCGKARMDRLHERTAFVNFIKTIFFD